MSSTTDLAGYTAVVTGASSGIGRAIAEQLAAHGVYVVISGRDETALDAVVSAIQAGGGAAVGIPVDLRDPLTVNLLVDAAITNTGRLDIFVNNAGVSYLGTILDADIEQWRNMLETNVLALLAGSKAAVTAMRAGGRPGHLVNISSVAALDPNSGVYGATKHAVNVITNTLRQELVDDPIKVTSIMPGLVATNIGRNVDPALLAGLVAMSGIDVEIVPGERLPDEVLAGAQAALSEIMMSPEDIAAAVLFAVTQPKGVDVTEIVVRPNKPANL